MSLKSKIKSVASKVSSAVKSAVSSAKAAVAPKAAAVKATVQKVTSNPTVKKVASVAKAVTNPAGTIAKAVSKPGAVKQQLAAVKDTVKKVATKVSDKAKSSGYGTQSTSPIGFAASAPKSSTPPTKAAPQPSVPQKQSQSKPSPAVFSTPFKVTPASPVAPQKEALTSAVTPPATSPAVKPPVTPPITPPAVPAPPSVPPIQQQQEALNQQVQDQPSVSPQQPPSGTPIQQSDLEKQYAALQGLSKEEEKAQKEQQALEQSYREGQQNVSEQPIAMSFISGQQASLENRFNNAQIPLQQKLANAQARRQASLDSVKFQLERSDKALDRAAKGEGEGFTLSEGEKRYDAQGRLIASGGAKSSSGGGASSAGGAGLSALAQAVQNGTIALDKLTPTQRGQVAAELSSAGVKPGSANFSETSQNALNAVNELLKDPSALARITGPIDQLVGGVFGKAALAKNQFKQLKGLLSLENIKYLKGTGAISDAEQRLLAEAASTIGRNLPANLLAQELGKLKTGLEALRQKGAATSAGGGVSSGDPLGIR